MVGSDYTWEARVRGAKLAAMKRADDIGRAGAMARGAGPGRGGASGRGPDARRVHRVERNVGPGRGNGPGRLDGALALAAVLVAAVVFVRIAWVCDDAYIVFRSVEQVFAGHGPRWNPHERVQVFTSPLWFGVLCVARAFTRDLFLGAVVASAAATGAMLALLRRRLAHGATFAAVVMAMLAANGVWDYTSSGLENPLAFLVLVAWLGAWRCAMGTPRGAAWNGTAGSFARGDAFAVVREPGDGSATAMAAARAPGGGNPAAARRLALAVALVLLCRLDLVFLVGPPSIVAWIRATDGIPRGRRLRLALVGLSPLVGWSLFALVYYGTVFPNPAYAKLATGIPYAELREQGLRYVGECLRRDPAGVVVPMLVATGFLVRRRDPWPWIAGGLLAHAAYVVAIGGDFMLGRFFGFPFVVAATAAAMRWREGVERGSATAPRWRAQVPRGSVAAALAAGLALAHTPLNSPWDYRVDPPHPAGVADERGVYHRASLRAWVRRDRSRVFPDVRWAREGRALRDSPACCAVRWSVGYFGYHAGTDKRIIDLFALCDPLLARLPADTRRGWRIGHFARRLPKGYAESVWTGRDLIEDPDYRRFAERVWLVTRSDRLLAPERLRTIAAMMAGR